MSTSNNIELALKQYGLNTEQISVYLFLVQHGDETPFHISKETGVPRTSVYRILEELRNSGLVTIFKKNNIAHYTAENPRRMLERLKEKETAVSSIIPAIDSLFKSIGSTPHTKLYVGENGARRGIDVFYEYLEKKGIKQIYTYSHHNLAKHLPKYLSIIIEKRKKLKIHVKMIAPSVSENSSLEHYQSDEWREVRFLPERYLFEDSMLIGGSMAICLSVKDNELHTIVLESENIIKMFTQFFLYMWESLD